MTDEAGKLARVVATPGTMSGQPRIDGTRMTVAQLLEYVRGGMTVEEISREWPHLPEGWWNAIIEWIGGHSAPDDGGWYSISVPLMPGDEHMRPEDIRLKYQLLEVLARMRGGITPGEMSRLGLNDAWQVIAQWVEDQWAAAELSRIDVEAVQAVLDSVPVPPDPGDELLDQADHEAQDRSTWSLQRDPGESDEEFELRRRVFTEGRVSIRVEDLPESVVERLTEIASEHPDTEDLFVFGSGNVARDLGIPNPDAVTFKWDLAGILALAMEDRNLDVVAVAEIAGEVEPAQVERITRGLVRDVDSYEIMRLLKSLGYRIVVDVLPPAEGVDGIVWINQPGGYRNDEKSREVLKGMDPPKKRPK